MVSNGFIWLNLLRVAFWPGTCSLLEDVPCAPENVDSASGGVFRCGWSAALFKVLLMLLFSPCLVFLFLI